MPLELFNGGGVDSTPLTRRMTIRQATRHFRHQTGGYGEVGEGAGMSDESPSSSDVYQEYSEFYDLHVGGRFDDLPMYKEHGAGFETTHADGLVEIKEFSVQRRHFLPGELEQLAVSQGFKVLEVSTGYNGDAPRPSSEQLVYVLGPA